MFQNQLLHGEEAANDVADITGLELSAEQLAAQEAMLQAQETKQAERLLEQYKEKKNMENELKDEEEMGKQHVSEQIDEQKKKVGSPLNFFWFFNQVCLQ